jgi:HPt (histidine-containing phosphotransfer) domain-containing protein
MSNPIDPAFHELQVEYLASMPERLEELRSDIAQFRAGTPGADASLKIRLHRLAGSGGSYGFVDLSSIAREAERWLAAHPAAAEADQLEALVERLARAVAEAGKRDG